MKSYDIYGIGAALVDIEYSVDDAFLSQNKLDKGIMTLSDETQQHQLINNLSAHSTLVKRSSGGSACNTVVAARGFGSKAFYAGKVGSDDDGQFFIQDLHDRGVGFHQSHPSAGITGKCLVMITEDAERTMNTFLGVNTELRSQEVDTRVLSDSKWLYMEGYLVTDPERANVAYQAMLDAKRSGVKTSLSLSDPFVVQVFLEPLKRVIGDGVDLLFCNADEAQSFTAASSVEGAAEALHDYAKSFVITLGENGSMVYDGNQLTTVPGVKIEAINTNGAGDMFAGAFLHAISCGHDYRLSAEFANAAAAVVVGQFGPRIEAPEYAQLKKQFGM